ncbi:MAG: hypothetical protein ABIJ50_02575 [Pseudomonadota bacterium]
MAKRTNYQSEKRSKEVNRLKKQNEKKERKKNPENDPPEDIPQIENEFPPRETD